MEMEKVPQAGYKIIGLEVVGLQRSLTLKNLLFPFKSITLRADVTDITTQDVKFVYFNTHQTDVAAIYGTPDGGLGTVTNAQLTSAKTKAALTVTMPTASALKTFHVYAILSPAPTDAACRPYGHRHVITDPALCPCVPQCLSVTVTKRKIP